MAQAQGAFAYPSKRSVEAVEYKVNSANALAGDPHQRRLASVNLDDGRQGQ
jgi:hypothetical protein